LIMNKDSLLLAGGTPPLPANTGGMQSTQITLGDTGLGVTISVWFDENAHAVRASLKTLFGAKAGEKVTCGGLVVS